MSRVLIFAAVLSIVVSSLTAGKKADETKSGPLFPRIHGEYNTDVRRDAGINGPARTPSPSDTFVLAQYNFDDINGRSTQGWFGKETYGYTVLDTFFHVSDNTELSGGDNGRLIVLEGSHSLWCGAPDADTGELCYYATLPGYGNSWSQQFTSVKFPHTGDVTLSFLSIWDSEPAEDRTYLDYLDKNGTWWNLAYYDYLPSGLVQLESFVIPDSLLADSLQIRFWFVSDGGWSDEDGMWPTDGAIVIDSLRVSDSLGEINFQNFEEELFGARVTNDGFWYAGTVPTFGNFTGLFSGQEVLQEDGCAGNFSGLWGFFKGSTDTYACGGHPEQLAVPWGILPSYSMEDYVHNEIWSPVIDFTQDVNGTPVPPTAGSAVLEFDVYRDLELYNYVFYYWRIRTVEDGCFQKWGNNTLYYGDQKDWYRHRASVGGYISPGATQVQVALGVADMCYVYCYYYGDATCHSHAPLFDNVRLVRVNAAGPSWDYLAFELFQDNFATNGTLTGSVRIDGSSLHPNGMPSDSAVVRVSSNVGIDYHVTGVRESGPAVYCHVKNIPPDKAGDIVSGNLSKYPVISTSGGWTKLQCYTSRYDQQGPAFVLDLNDALYQPGDSVLYYFSARDNNGVTDYWSVHAGVTTSEVEVRENPCEMTCLPANALNGATDILYVDGFDGYGAQPFFETAFEVLGLTPDRFDILDPSFHPGGGPGARVVNVSQQLMPVYKKIVWNTGHLANGGIHDGLAVTWRPISSDDFGMLFEFLDQNPNGPGLYLSGDNVASMWQVKTGSGSVNLRSTYLSFGVVSDSHTGLGEPVSPLALGLPGSCFDDGSGVDTLIAFGGDCFGVNKFDVLDASGAATVAMAYSGVPTRGAVVTQLTQNSVGDTARVVLSGFSFHNIRDHRPGQPPARTNHLAAILRWLENDVDDPVGTKIPVVRFVNTLAQNHPNPFNPVTTIEFTLEKRGHVELAVYDVAGRHVRSLLSETRLPGIRHVIEWDGTDGAGRVAPSGVYFYRLVAGGFTSTKKMVLCK